MRSVLLKGVLASTLVLFGAFELAGAQVRVVPSLGTAAREYGLSGLYTSHEDTAGIEFSSFDVRGRWGYITTLGVEFELESGYMRDRVDSIKTHSFRIMGNAIYNWNFFSRTTVFGLVGYGYNWDWGDANIPGLFDETSMRYSILQYGVGVKYYFVPNAGIRVEYRWENARGLDDALLEEDYSREKLLIGVSIFQ